MSGAVSNAIVAGYRAARRLSYTSITYTRGANSVELTVIPGEMVHSVERDGELIDTVHSRDYLILASELVLDSAEVVPVLNDVITENGINRRVLNIGGEAQWRWTDPHQVIIRVHTKEV